MPTQIIRRPDYVGDSITGIIARAREKERIDEERHRQEEARLKRARTIGIGAAVGGLGGLALAPALGLAGTAAGSGMFAGVPATAGALGAGGSLSGLGALTAGLTGAQLGAQVGQGIDSGDIAPALGSAANISRDILADQENRRVFGYNATPQERAAFAREAIDHGLDFGAMVSVAQAGGVPVSRQLSIARAAQSSDAALQTQLNDANIRMEPGAFRAAAAQLPGGSTELFGNIARQQQEQQLAFDTQRAGAMRGAELDAVTQKAVETGNMEMVMPPENISKIRTAYDRLDGYQRDLDAGNIDEAKYNAAMDETTEEVRRLSQPRPRQKQPSVTSFDGSEHPMGSTWLTPSGNILRAAMDSKGNPQVEKVGEETQAKRLPWSDHPSGIQGWTKDNTVPGVGLVLPEGYKIFDAKPSPGQATSNDIINGLFKADSTGDIPAFSNPEAIGQAIITGDRIEQVPKLRSIVDQFESNPTAITPAAVGELVRNAKYVYGDAWLNSDVGRKIAMFDQYITAQQPQPMGPPSELAQPATTALPSPPAGSAASAEEVAFAESVEPAKRQIKAAGNAIADFGNYVGNKAGSALAAISGKPSDISPQEQQASFFATVQKQNILAGIDSPVGLISPSGNVVNVIKGSLTPEKIAEYKAAGFQLPGID